MRCEAWWVFVKMLCTSILSKLLDNQDNLKILQTRPGLTCLQYACLSLLIAFQLFIYRKTEEIRAHTVCRRGFLKSQRFNVRSTHDWQYGQSLSSDLQRRRVDERVAVTRPGNLQQHRGDPSELLTPLRYTTAAQDAVRDVNEGAAAQMVLVTVSLNRVWEVMWWNSFRSFMSANLRRDHRFGWQLIFG